MARVVGIDHLVIRVADFAKSKRFYGKVLGCLGFALKYEFDHTAGWSNGKTLFWIGEADAEGKRHPHRIGNIGFHHYAFELARRRDVDELYAALKRAKAVVVDPPADYPDYGKGYYAVFFLDPDGLKLEGMFFPKARRPKTAKAPRKSKR
ncbi:MAG: VOC family protein [Alphaproteobacteria bacterium]